MTTLVSLMEKNHQNFSVEKHYVFNAFCLPLSNFKLKPPNPGCLTFDMTTSLFDFVP